MSILSVFSGASLTGRKAYRCHVEGNRMIDNGNIAGAREKHEQALKLYKEAYDAGNRDAAVIMAYAVLLLRFDGCEQAEKLMLECEKMKLDAKARKDLRVNYAVCQWRLGRLDKAIENLEIAASNGSTAVIMTTLGYLYLERGLKTGDYSKAFEYNTEALEYDDEDAGILDNLGQLCYFTGKTDEAYDYFARAYKQKHTQAPTLYYIAKINLERGNMEKAKGFVDKCLESNFNALCTITRAQAEELKKQIYAKL